ncbi:thioredoxin family protein [Pseudomonas vanderleydeniana]|uniref:Thioredoxin family protein n=1 Tax=Pseudomonas vanderleydeniana TaxID=2745495 RepID=A0A9E6PJ11_9PSED|nr:thioredoxin family protein [Pseudomonas vanderleydeniana]QXI27607.1 thioredoxin family protein [Pseudomonas vanderleydeniana]
MKSHTPVMEIKTRRQFRSELGSLEVPLIRPKPSVVLVYSRGCPPCEQLRPQIAALAAGPYRDRVAFFQLSYPILKLLQPNIEIQFVPALFFLDGHGGQTRLYGTDREKIKQGFDSLLFVTDKVFSEVFDSQAS